MNRNVNKRRLVVMLLILFVLSVSIGYAFLTQKLSIDNTVSYDAMKWDVGFTSSEDGWDIAVDKYIEDSTNGTMDLESIGFNSRNELESYLKESFLDNRLVAKSSANISSDKKSIDVICNVELSTSRQLCIVKATISNFSTFNVSLKDISISDFDSDYINFTNLVWLNHNSYDLFSVVGLDQVLEIGESADILFMIFTNKLTEDMLSIDGVSIPVSLSLEFVEAEESVNQSSMLISHSDGSYFWSDTYKENIKTINFENKINIPENAIKTWDLSNEQDGKIMSYVVHNKNDATYYDLYIQCNGKIYANYDMSKWFSYMQNVDSINGLELLDTSYTTDMSWMFEYTGYNSEILTLNVSNFDTSNVINMSGIFSYAGCNSTEFTVDVSKFDTSKVTDISFMFFAAGCKSNNFTTSLTIRNPNISIYNEMFDFSGFKGDSKITLNYTSETSELVDLIIYYDWSGANVVKGELID